MTEGDVPKQLQSFIYHPQVIVEWVFMGEKQICLEILMHLKPLTDRSTGPKESLVVQEKQEETENSVKDAAYMHWLVERRVKPG